MSNLSRLFFSSLTALIQLIGTVTIAFKLINDPSTALLAWTTTPWTLPTNLALCVHPEFTYIKIHDKERDTNFILCDKLLSTLYKDAAKAKKEKKYEVLETYKGKDLVGIKYEPLFDYFKEKVSYIVDPSSSDVADLVSTSLRNSTPIEHSRSSPTLMLPTLPVPVSFTKLPLLVTTITVSLFEKVSLERKRCLLALSTRKVSTPMRFLISLVNTSR